MKLKLGWIVSNIAVIILGTFSLVLHKKGSNEGQPQSIAPRRN